MLLRAGVCVFPALVCSTAHGERTNSRVFCGSCLGIGAVRPTRSNDRHVLILDSSVTSSVAAASARVHAEITNQDNPIPQLVTMHVQSRGVAVEW